MTLKRLAALAVFALAPAALSAQAIRSASRPIGLSVFAGGSGVYTGFGRNASFTAGFDINFHPDSRLFYALEVRGTEPVKSGTIAEEKNFLAGPRVNFVHRRFRPYGDILIGRGEIDYFGAGLQVPGQLLFYTKTHSTVLAGGGGLNYQLGEAFALKADIQAQRYATPVTTSGYVTAKSITLGLEYTFPFHGRKGVAEY